MITLRLLQRLSQPNNTNLLVHKNIVFLMSGEEFREKYSVFAHKCSFNLDTFFLHPVCASYINVSKNTGNFCGFVNV